MLKIAGMWKTKKKESTVIMSGTILGNTRLLIMKNKNKTKENHPDYIAYIVENSPQETENKAGQAPDSEEF